MDDTVGYCIHPMRNKDDEIIDKFGDERRTEILDLDEAVKDSDCIVIISDHSQFKEIEPEKISKLMRNKNIVDSRNILDISWLYFSTDSTCLKTYMS